MLVTFKLFETKALCSKSCAEQRHHICNNDSTEEPLSGLLPRVCWTSWNQKEKEFNPISRVRIQ